jgi:hypothetical protein
MTTWTELYTELKTSLGDDTRWGELELVLYTNQIIRTYSRYFPQESSTTLATDGSTKSWALPSTIIRARSDAVNRVELDEGGNGYPRFLEQIQIKPGTQYYDIESYYPLMWYVEGGYFKLTSALDSDDDLTLHFYALHDEVVGSYTSTAQAAEEMSVPDVDLECIHLGVHMKASQRVMYDDANLSRFDLGGLDSGNPTHNPLIRPYQLAYEEFWDSIYRRLPTGVIEFHRRGRGE